MEIGGRSVGRPPYRVGGGGFLAFAGGGEGDFGEVFLHAVQFPAVADQVDGRAFAVFRHGGAVLFDEGFQARCVRGKDPAGGVVGGGFEGDGDGIFLFDAAGEHVELQGADDADDPVRAGDGAEDLGDAFFRQIFQRLAHLLGFHRIGQADAAEDFRCEIGDAGEADFLAGFRQRVADAERAVIGDADDVAGIGFLSQ